MYIFGESLLIPLPPFDLKFLESKGWALFKKKELGPWKGVCLSVTASVGWTAMLPVALCLASEPTVLLFSLLAPKEILCVVFVFYR